MMNRRRFLASCGSGAALAAELSQRLGAFVPPRSLFPTTWAHRGQGSPGATRAWGIQLYTVREAAKADLSGTLTALAAIGYSEVEFAGLHGHPANEVRRMLDAAGLAAPAGHVAIEALDDIGVEATIAEAHALGHRYLIIPWIPENRRSVEGYAGVAETFNRAGRTVRDAGMTLGYHNHDFEFLPLDGTASGRCGYDVLLERTEPELVAMELDLFWIRKGGRDAFAYLRRHAGRFRLVHIKDMDAAGEMVDLGRGVMPWHDLLDAAQAAGVRHWFAEHDTPADPMAFARGAISYLRSAG